MITRKLEAWKSVQAKCYTGESLHYPQVKLLEMEFHKQLSRIPLYLPDICIFAEFFVQNFFTSFYYNFQMYFWDFDPGIVW